MKIGILTQPLCQNYGGILQNYALQQVLIREGYDVQTIDHGRFQRSSKIRYLLGIMKKYIMNIRNKKKKYVPNKKEMNVIAKNTQYFIDKYICHTIRLNSHREFEELASKEIFDIYIVGSDQCWRPKYNRSFLKEMYLSFIEKQKNKKRIAYAVSFGTDKWEYTDEMTKECARLAKKFDLVTVREDSGLFLCKEHLGVEAMHVLDPTMLLSKEDYIRLVGNENEAESHGNLFYYILDPSDRKLQFINDIVQKKKLIPFTILPTYQAENRTEYNVKKEIDKCVYPSVTSWLRAFMDAKMTIVDSFHGMVFSIIFNKPFWVIGNEERGMSRFTSLLKIFGLQNRLVNEHNLKDLDWERAIDWKTVNQIRNEKLQYSIKLLLDGINNKE